MAHRNRKRTRPRRHAHRDQIPISTFLNPSPWSNSPYVNKVNSRSTARHWQTQWDTWQSCRQGDVLPILASRGEAEPSMAANFDMMKHRLQLFGGEEDDGSDLCGPMLSVVMNLFDGGLDYADP